MLPNPVSAVRGPIRDESHALVTEILNIMEQGIVFWSAEGKCELHNSRIFRVLELNATDLKIGTAHVEFDRRALMREEMSEEVYRYSQEQIRGHMPYSFDREMPSGRVVFTNGRPTRGGGYVVTFTDVTEARRAAQELSRAKSEAEAAQGKAVKLLEQERERQDEAKLLSQLDEWLQSCKSLNELYSIVTRFMARLLPMSKGELYIYSRTRDGLEGVCNWGTKDLHKAIEADSCWALRRGRSYEFTVEGLCFLCDHVEAHHHNVPIEEYICVPIMAHGDTVGLLHIRFDTAAEEGARIANAGDFAVSCAEHISMAIANVRLRDELHERSIRDALTGLHNRRFFMERMRKEVMRCEQQGGKFALVSFDTDNFKMFNDSHGHEAGDLVLQAISKAALTVVPSRAWVCRIGGEEFAVILPDVGVQEGQVIADRLREVVAGKQIRFQDQMLPQITFSAGVGGYPETAKTGENILQLTDEALYRAKGEGRNCVRVAQPLASVRLAPEV